MSWRGKVNERGVTRLRFRLQYPNGLATIGDMGKETVLKLAVDFDTSKSHPKMTQFTLRPKNKSLQPLIYAMDYKSASSKAVLNIVKLLTISFC